MTRLDDIEARLEAEPVAGVLTASTYADLRYLLKVARAAEALRDGSPELVAPKILGIGDITAGAGGVSPEQWNASVRRGKLKEVA